MVIHLPVGCGHCTHVRYSNSPFFIPCLTIEAASKRRKHLKIVSHFMSGRMMYATGPVLHSLCSLCMSIDTRIVIQIFSIPAMPLSMIGRQKTSSCQSHLLRLHENRLILFSLKVHRHIEDNPSTKMTTTNTAGVLSFSGASNSHRS